MRPDGALVNAKKPALHQREDSMHGGQVLARVLGVVADLGLVLVPTRLQGRIARPSVSASRRARFHIVFDELHESRLALIVTTYIRRGAGLRVLRASQGYCSQRLLKS